MMFEDRYLEPQIKLSVIDFLIKKKLINKSDTIINEFNVGDFSRRVDLSLISSNKLFAFEIKSEYDSLYRLNGQIETYLKYFDKVFIITTKKYIDKVLSTTTPNVAVWEINNGVIKVIRKGQIEKITNKNSMISMLNVNELYKLLRTNNIKITNKKRINLEQTAAKIPSYKIRYFMLNALKQRYMVTSDNFLEKAYESNININDLKLLSNQKIKKTNTNDIKNENLSYYIDALTLM